MLNRRRALMSVQGGNDSTIVIKGSNQTWEKGWYTATGATEANDYCIRSTNYFPINNNRTVTYTGPETTTGSIHYYCYMYQYAADKTVISRRLLIATNGTITSFYLNENCAYLRFAFGHPAASSVPMELSESSVFEAEAVQGQPIGVNLVDSVLSGYTVSPTTGQLASATNASYTDYIPVFAGYTYELGKYHNRTGYYALYNTSKTFVSGDTISNQYDTKNLAVTSDGYIRWSVGSATGSTALTLKRIA